MVISEALVLLKTIQKRKNELLKLRDNVSNKEWYPDSKKTIEPQYDVKEVDMKIVQLETMEYNIERRVKNANACTKIDFECDIKQILSPIT